MHLRKIYSCIFFCCVYVSERVFIFLLDKMDHAVVENEKRQTDIKTNVKNEAPAGIPTSTLPPDTTTFEGTYANEANPNVNPR